MLAHHTSLRPAPFLACRGVRLRRHVRPNAFGNALGNSIAQGIASSGSQQAQTLANNRSALNAANRASDPGYYSTAAHDPLGDLIARNPQWAQDGGWRAPEPMGPTYYPQPGSPDFMGPMPSPNRGPTLMGSQTITAGKNAGGLLAVLGQNGFTTQSDKFAAAGYLKVMDQWAPGANVMPGQQLTIDRDILEAARPEFEKIGREAVSAEGRQRAAEERAEDIARMQSRTRYSQADRQADPNYVYALMSQQKQILPSPLEIPPYTPPGIPLVLRDPDLEYFDHRGKEFKKPPSPFPQTEVVLAKYDHFYIPFSITKPKSADQYINTANQFLGIYEGGALATEGKIIATYEGQKLKGGEVRIYGSAKEGFTYAAGKGTFLGDGKVSYNIGTAAQAYGEVNAKFDASSGDVTGNIVYSADAALIRGQTKGMYPFKLGQLAIEAGFQGEAHFLGWGATLEAKFERVGSRGTWELGGGATPIVGGKGKFILNWSWKP
jgi:hypothetical protein